MAHILMMAKADVESEIWRQACSQYAGQLASMLDDALCFFGRKPGLDDLTRMHLVMLTNLGFELLGEALECHSRKAWHVRHPDFIELRWQLRMHLKRYLGERLVRDGFAFSSIRDEHFADDLGL
ncbi:hypothetical protein [Pseudomonas simiae]|uniref:Uncharacterized protein n=1 Tax=Pseudomonas simiae TaxID=321846 RepID=A0A1N7ULI5_9PSED|nr:hypothetical protein [Pseudomonas simiae]AIB37893.1 hypothetical protein PS417_20385 [Pseudomonas simiae]